jgi:type 1 glutamine amidotransferase
MLERRPQRIKAICAALRAMLRALTVALLASAALLTAPAGAAEARFRVLVFSATEGYRHASIPAGIAAVRALGARHGFSVDATEDPASFTTRRLRRYAAVVFLSTTGDVLDRHQQTAFRRYIRRGGGFAGVHAAADTEYGWGWYGRLLGARFRHHPDVQPATIRVIDRRHPSTRSLPRRWQRTDEWYDFRAQPRRGTRVLALLDESSYSGGQMGARHPIAWCRRFEGGRSWYTALGHTEDSYAEPRFRRHLLGGIGWAAGR